MNKKDYVVLAEAVRNMTLSDMIKHYVVSVLCNYLGEDNERFNAELFRRRCEVRHEQDNGA